MSRYYNMIFAISGFKEEKKDEIVNSINTRWKIEDNYNNDYIEKVFVEKDIKLPNTFLSMEGRYNLYNGQSEEEFFDEIKEKIWNINEGYCIFVLEATYLEDIPCDSYKTNYESYEQFILGKEK